MLVLSRKLGESIQVGPDVTVTVLAVEGNKVRLGITAPEEIPIWRAELILDDAGLPVRSALRSGEARPAAAH